MDADGYSGQCRLGFLRWGGIKELIKSKGKITPNEKKKETFSKGYLSKKEREPQEKR